MGVTTYCSAKRCLGHSKVSSTDGVINCMSSETPMPPVKEPAQTAMGDFMKMTNKIIEDDGLELEPDYFLFAIAVTFVAIPVIFFLGFLIMVIQDALGGG